MKTINIIAKYLLTLSLSLAGLVLLVAPDMILDRILPTEYRSYSSSPFTVQEANVDFPIWKISKSTRRELRTISRTAILERTVDYYDRELIRLAMSEAARIPAVAMKHSSDKNASGYALASQRESFDSLRTD